MSFSQLCEQLKVKIQESYAEGVTQDAAEKLAGEFLHGQLAASSELKKADLDSRMRKTSVKAIRAAIYMEGATKDPKKPSDVLLQAMVDMDKIVQAEQESYDKAEVERDDLERYYHIFREAHIHFRSLAKGRFE